MKHAPNLMALRQTAAVLWPPVSFRSEQISKWTMALLVFAVPFLFVLVLLLTAINVPGHLTWSSLGGALGAGFTISLFLAVLTYIVLMWIWNQWQFSPVHATLVPGLRRRLPWATAIPMIGGPVLLVSLLYLTAKQPPLAPVWFISILFASFIVAGMRAQWLHFILVGAVAAQILPWKTMMGGLLWSTLVDWVSTPWLVVPLGLVIATWTLRWTYSLRGDLHFDIRRKQVKTGAIRSTDSVTAIYNQRMMFGHFHRYMMWRITKASGLTRTMQRLVTGPRMHWTGLFGIFAVAVGAALALLWLRRVPTQGGDLFLVTAVGALSGLAIASVAYLGAIPQVIWSTRPEQGLVCLTERAAPLQQQGPLHLTYFVQQSLVRWGGSMAVALAFSFTTDISFLQPPYVCALGFSLLPGTAWVITNYAEIQGPVQAKAILWLFALNLGLMGIAIKLLANYPDTVALPWCAAMVVLTVAIGLYRWRKVSDVAAMFPAGRAA